MQRILLLLFISFFLSCSSEESEIEIDRSSPENETRIWHKSDTVLSNVKWNSDSIRQIKLNLTDLSGLNLEAQADAPIYLFYGDRLIQKSSNDYLRFTFDSIAEESVYISLDEGVKKLSFGLYSLAERNGNGHYARLENAERESKWISDNVLLMLLMGAAMFMVIVKANYDKRYLNILSFNKVFTTRLNEGDQSRVRIMDQDNLVFSGLYAFLTAGFIYFLSLGNQVGFLGIEADGILAYLKIVSIVAVGLIAKVILVAIVSNLFGNSKISAFYVKEMLNINLFFVIILFFSSILIFLLDGSIPAFWLDTARYSMIVFYFVRLILLYFKILKLSSFTNLYLFSYFCTTEIFPFLIGLKYFMR